VIYKIGSFKIKVHAIKLNKINIFQTKNQSNVRDLDVKSSTELKTEKDIKTLEGFCKRLLLKQMKIILRETN